MVLFNGAVWRCSLCGTLEDRSCEQCIEFPLKIFFLTRAGPATSASCAISLHRQMPSLPPLQRCVCRLRRARHTTVGPFPSLHTAPDCNAAARSVSMHLPGLDIATPTPRALYPLLRLTDDAGTGLGASHLQGCRYSRVFSLRV